MRPVQLTRLATFPERPRYKRQHQIIPLAI
jgi:hypothetical protein